MKGNGGRVELKYCSYKIGPQSRHDNRIVFRFPGVGPDLPDNLESDTVMFVRNNNVIRDNKENVDGFGRDSAKAINEIAQDDQNIISSCSYGSLLTVSTLNNLTRDSIKKIEEISFLAPCSRRNFGSLQLESCQEFVRKCKEVNHFPKIIISVNENDKITGPDEALDHLRNFLSNGYPPARIEFEYSLGNSNIPLYDVFDRHMHYAQYPDCVFVGGGVMRRNNVVGLDEKFILSIQTLYQNAIERQKQRYESIARIELGGKKPNKKPNNPIVKIKLCGKKPIPQGRNKNRKGINRIKNSNKETCANTATNSINSSSVEPKLITPVEPMQPLPEQKEHIHWIEPSDEKRTDSRKRVPIFSKSEIKATIVPKKIYITENKCINFLNIPADPVKQKERKKIFANYNRQRLSSLNTPNTSDTFLVQRTRKHKIFPPKEEDDKKSIIEELSGEQFSTPPTPPLENFVESRITTTYNEPETTNQRLEESRVVASLGGCSGNVEDFTSKISKILRNHKQEEESFCDIY